MKVGRPLTYDESIIAETEAYIESCEDVEDEYHATRGEKSDTYKRLIRVKLPTIEGLAASLGVHKDTIYDWETKYPQFSDVLAVLRAKQAATLINKGLSGDYNPVIARLLLVKHGYRDAVDTDVTSAGQPIIQIAPEIAQKNGINASATPDSQG